MIDPTQIQYYLKTPNGVLGPYANRVIAETAKMMLPINEQTDAIVEGKTADGKTILLG